MNIANHAPQTFVFAGLHLSSLTVKRSCLVTLTISEADFLQVNAVTDKIGSMGPVSSDDRLIKILSCQQNLCEIFVDCPLGLPPCVACTLPACPGVERCDDTAVAFMQALNAQTEFAESRKKKPINPQIQRVWDVWQIKQLDGQRIEPSFSANQAHLVIRANTLQKRLQHSLPHVRLLETSPGIALTKLGDYLLGKHEWSEYRSFSKGAGIRREILQCLTSMGLNGRKISISTEFHQLLVQSAACFSAFVCALVGYCYRYHTVSEAPEFLPEEHGWVYLPEMGL